MSDTYITFEFRGGPIDGFDRRNELYLPISVREVVGFVLPPSTYDDCIQFDEEMHCAMTLQDFMENAVETPDYPAGLYRQFKGCPGELVYVGPLKTV